MRRDDSNLDLSKNTHQVDNWVRSGLTPDEDAVHRVVSGALEAGERKEPLSRYRKWALAALFVLTLCAVGYYALRDSGPKDHELLASFDPSRIETVTITNVSGEVELLFPKGEGTLPSSTRVELSNENDVVLLVLGNGTSKYWIFGGEP